MRGGRTIDGQQVKDHAQELHRRALVVDAHADTLLRIWAGERTLRERSSKGHIDLPRLAEGGVDVQFFACFIEAQHKPERGLRRAMQLVDLFHRELAANADRMMPVLRASDLAAAQAAGKVGAVLSIEGGEAIGDDLSALRNLHRLGLRSLGLVWNQRNLIADGVGEARTHGGLTNFGVEVVQECNRLGILVDVSHLNDEGLWDVLATSTKPIVATHSNARAVCPHPRNLSDDLVKALAKNGGVMGMCFAPGFLRAMDIKAESIEEYRRQVAGMTSVDSVVGHIDHLIELVGPDHVGLGSDFDGSGAVPDGLSDVSCLPALTEALVARGYSDEVIEKILGLNFRRVFEAVVG
ncbi:MAG: dipeptidase [Bacillota bacterium]